MRADLAALSRILAVVNRAALWIAGIGLVLMTVFVAWQVFGRYVLNQSPSWTEPASLLLMSWFILLGSAVGVREGNHLGFEIGSPLCAARPAPDHARRDRGAGDRSSAWPWPGTARCWPSRPGRPPCPGLPIPQGVRLRPARRRRRADRAVLSREARSPAARRRRRRRWCAWTSLISLP